MQVWVGPITLEQVWALTLRLLTRSTQPPVSGQRRFLVSNMDSRRLLSDIPGGVAGLIGVFQTGSAYSSGDYLGASQAGGATLGGIAGAEAGAAAGSLFGPFDVVTTPMGAVIGGVA